MFVSNAFFVAFPLDSVLSLSCLSCLSCLSLRSGSVLFSSSRLSVFFFRSPCRGEISLSVPLFLFPLQGGVAVVSPPQLVLNLAPFSSSLCSPPSPFVTAGFPCFPVSPLLFLRHSSVFSSFPAIAQRIVFSGNTQLTFLVLYPKFWGPQTSSSQQQNFRLRFCLAGVPLRITFANYKSTFSNH